MLDLLRDRYAEAADQVLVAAGLAQMAEGCNIAWDDARRVATLRRVDIEEPGQPRVWRIRETRIVEVTDAESEQEALERYMDSFWGYHPEVEEVSVSRIVERLVLGAGT